jgi:aspartyl-tRNA(Asn)/glutamyl-tRNA(Gln) amidotransferase subunit C
MIKDDELKKLQKLSKISFSKEELDIFAKKLNIVIEMIDTLKEVDCKGVEPLRSVCDMHQRFREDEVTISNIADQLFANVPAKNSQFAKEVKCFIVPKMVE